MGVEAIELSEAATGSGVRRPPPRTDGYRRLPRLAAISIVALTIGAAIITEAVRASHPKNRAVQKPTTSTPARIQTKPPPIRFLTGPSRLLSLRAPDGWTFGETFDLGGSLWVSLGQVNCSSSCGGSWWRIDTRTGTVSHASVATREYDEGINSGLGSFWMLNYKLDNTPFTLRRVDPSSGRVLAETTVRGTGTMGQAFRNWIVAGYGSVWVEASGKLIRLDPDTLHETARLSVPQLRAAVIDHGVLWAIDSGDGGLWRVDPETNTATQVVRTCCYAQTIAADGRYIWFTHNTRLGHQDLVRVSETAPFRAIDTGIPAAGVAASANSVWFLGTVTDTSNSQPGVLVRLDSDTRRARQATLLNVPTVSYLGASLIVIDGAAWVDDSNIVLHRIEATAE